MQRLIIAIAAAVTSAFSLATAVKAETLDVSTVTCQQLVDSMSTGSKNDRYGMGGILYWIAGYETSDDQGSIVDFDGLGKDFDKILADCKEKPNVGVLSVASGYLGEHRTEPGSGAVDIATLTCQAALENNKSDDDGLGLILMWITGYMASDDENKVFDSEAFVADMQKVGESCGADPNVGLLTTAEKVMGGDSE
jgi:acid stress chaperone HdeB